MTPDLLAVAIEYVAVRGWSVIPVHQRSKKPAIPWEEFQHRHATDDELEEWFGDGTEHNIGIVCGAISGNLVVLDADGEEGERTLAGLRLPRTVRVKTPHGTHAYFRGDALGTGARVLPGVDVRGEGGYVVAPPSVGKDGERYSWVAGHEPDGVDVAPLPAKLRATAAIARRPKSVRINDAPIPEGRRNDELTRIGGRLLDSLGHPELVVVLEALNQTRCKPPLGAEEVRGIVKSLEGYRPPTESALSKDDPPEDDWPILDDAALYGLAGEVVRVIAPHTEADPVGILFDFLTCFGNCVGPGPFIRVERRKHPPRLNLVLVGDTASARKGTGRAWIVSLFEHVDSEWAREHVMGGLASGEGLIAAVRDADDDPHDVGDPGRTDYGVKDKRLLAEEEEFGRVLIVAGREGSTLSTILRQAWDTGNLRVMTRRDPLRASGAYISMLAHITREELRRLLTSDSIANGFANRFLFVVVRRSKLLPRGGHVEEKELSALTRLTRKRAEGARSLGEITWGTDAGELWDTLYAVMAEEVKPGLVGALLARAEAHVLRLSLVYALLDGSSVIEEPHLNAGWALWRYVRDSVQLTFGEASGDPVRDQLLAAIAERGEMSYAEQYDYFGRHVSKDALKRSRASLLSEGLLGERIITTAGRPRTVNYLARLRVSAERGSTDVR